MQMTRSKEYIFLLEWLEKEPNVDLIVPYIKEVLGQVIPVKAIKTDLQKNEVNFLRERVRMIKEKGHQEYTNKTTQAIFAAKEVFGNEVKEI